MFADNDDERGENNSGEYFPVYSIKKNTFVLSLDAIDIRFVVVNAAVVHQRNDLTLLIRL